MTPQCELTYAIQLLTQTISQTPSRPVAAEQLARSFHFLLLLVIVQVC